MDHQNSLLARELDHPFHESEVDGRSGRIVRKIHHQQLGPGPTAVDRSHQRIEKILAAADRHSLHLRACDDASVLMDRVGRSGSQHHVALVQDGKRQVRDTLLRADGDDRFRVGIKLDSVTAAIPIGDRQAQLVDPARDRV